VGAAGLADIEVPDGRSKPVVGVRAAVPDVDHDTGERTAELRPTRPDQHARRPGRRSPAGHRRRPVAHGHDRAAGAVRLDRCVQHRRRAGEPGGPDVDRLLVDLDRRRELDDVPAAQHRHAVGDR
jgi:hypothetical protein